MYGLVVKNVKRRKTTKKAPSLAAVYLIFIAGIGVMLYPFAGNRYNQWLQDRLIEEYDHSVAAISPEVLETEREACMRYNEGLLGNVVLTDPFDVEAMNQASEVYGERLNLNGDGVMGYLEIPKINVKLAIYHGTDSKTLEKGVGHLENTSLPIGGKSTHAVLSAHTAHANATLFNHLTDLEEGDTFFLTVLDDILAYQVDRIKVVVPEDTGGLMIDRDEDYVTLVTCTPYGVNSHRLLVRGTRIPYVEEAAVIRPENGRPYQSVILPISLFALLLVIFIIVTKRRSRRKEVKNEKEK